MNAHISLFFSDVPTKQFLLRLDREHKFIIKAATGCVGFWGSHPRPWVLQDLDETHLFVKKGCEQLLQQKLDQYQEANTFEEYVAIE